MILVTIDRLFALFGKRSIFIFARISCCFDQASVNNLSCFELKALFSELALELVKTFAVKVHGFEVRTETGDGRVIRDRIDSGEAEEAAVEEVAMEHGFHFRVGVAIDLLDDEDFEHEDGVVGLAAEFRGVEFSENSFERFPMDEFINAIEDIFREILIDEMFADSYWGNLTLLRKRAGGQKGF